MYHKQAGTSSNDPIPPYVSTGTHKDDWDGIHITDTPINLETNPFNPPKGSSCPINQLPAELLSHIFMVGTLDAAEEVLEEEDMSEEDDMSDDDEEEEGEGEAPEFQVLVSHVCKHWREVALQTPALWTTIDFAEGAPFEKSATWVERSKGCALDIGIDCCPDDDDGEQEDDEDEDDEDEDEDDGEVGPSEKPPSFTLQHLTAAMIIVEPHIARWKSFQIGADTYEYIYLALTRLSKCPPAPLLELLQFHIYDDWDDVSVFAPANLRDPFHLIFQGEAPKLTQISLWGVHISWSQSHFLSGLTELEMAYHTEDVRPSFTEFTQILRNSTSLETLALSASGPAGSPEDWYSEDNMLPFETIEIPTLKNLVLAYFDPKYASGLMNTFYPPNLESLTLDFDEHDWTDFVNQLSTPRPGKTKSLFSTLTHLKISALACNSAAVNTMYTSLVNLKSINLNFDHMDEHFFQKLAQPVAVNLAEPNAIIIVQESMAGPKTPMFLPNLEAITTSGIGGPDMKAFVEVRKRAGVPLKTVFMNQDDDVEEAEEAFFREQLESFEFFEGSEDELDLEPVEVDDGANEWEDED
ncbi:hypothetical protein JAAARDRAFT_30333 [Jaapia argillacea MUCL 33604]|uniref:Uncharacterized protein n=1 Tax=Jaapia argillacea MUCL 33604 TaxID=933084 RepID=A0A067Q8H9_9AGAM|nr:hypothetical protein JAAARDRAFT_30333 [Jaapia argillacea MUCL 33604]